MKKIYSKILLVMLLTFASLKQLFFKNVIAFYDGDLMGSIKSILQSPIEKIISGIKLIMLSPILIVGIALFLIYIIFKIKRKDVKNINIFLVSGALGIMLYYFLYLLDQSQLY